MHPREHDRPSNICPSSFFNWSFFSYSFRFFFFFYLLLFLKNDLSFSLTFLSVFTLYDFNTFFLFLSLSPFPLLSLSRLLLISNGLSNCFRHVQTPALVIFLSMAVDRQQKAINISPLFLYPWDFKAKLYFYLFGFHKPQNVSSYKHRNHCENIASVFRDSVRIFRWDFRDRVMKGVP